jgi:hypothetical protein
MKILIAASVGLLLLTGCKAEKTNEAPPGPASTPAAETQAAEPAAATANESVATGSLASTATDENHEAGTWTGQVKVGQPVSMFNYVGVESGDFAPIRFRSDSEAGKKLLAACSNDDLCEFTGVVEWLDETPPADASAIGQVVRVESARRLPPTR